MQIRNFGYGSTSQPMKEDYRSTPPFADRLGGIHPNHHEVLYISEGKVQLNFISQIYVIEGPALILIPLNTYHKLVLISKNYSYFYWELEDKDSNLFPEFEICTIWNHLQLHMNESFTEQSMITRRIDYLSQILKSDWATEQQSLFHQMSLSDITTILALIRHVVQTYETQENKNKNKTLIHREAPAPAKDTIEMLVRWMEASYWEKITLQTLSDFVHLNPSYLIRMFKKYKGITPFQYLNDLRMKAATGYLSNSSMGVQEIVDKTGYQSIHYFSRVFKQKHGKSPIQWRMDRLGKTSEQ